MTPVDIRTWADRIDLQTAVGCQVDPGEPSRIVAEALRLLAEAQELRAARHSIPRFVRGQARLRAWREFRGFSVAELARKVGISEAYVWQLEAKHRVGTLKTLRRIAEALSISVSEMVDAGSGL